MTTFKELAKVITGEVYKMDLPEKPVEYLLTDSRKLAPPSEAIFIAINGERHNGHEFIPNLLKLGIRQFIIEQPVDFGDEEVNVIRVPRSLKALQEMAAYKRSMFNIPVIGITGSNGKTIVKEWLAQLLAPYQSVVKSPGSYNSQVGVPLSVWRLSSNHEIAIIEAGISKKNEMQALQQVIKPTIGIFTNIGDAHDEGFKSKEEKVKEKARLFERAQTVIYCKDHELIDQQFGDRGFSWGFNQASDLIITYKENSLTDTRLSLMYGEKKFKFELPFSNNAYVENAMHCVAYLIWAGYNEQQIQAGLGQLRTVKMRLQLKPGINNCQLIDDTYNNDLGGLQVAMDFLFSHSQPANKTLILSDLLQTGLDTSKLYQAVYDQIKAAEPGKVIAIGPEITSYFKKFKEIQTYNSTADFLAQHDMSSFENELILVKGARNFQFEKIVNRLEEKIHGTQLEINLDALTHNLNYYRSKLKKGTRLMVMVKAFAYGSGSLEVANLLQNHRVDYLGVAYADEGVELRKNGIYLPIMVMNPTEESFLKLKEYNLDPEIYNLNILQRYINFLDGRKGGIHLKLDTGMHRLGFREDELSELSELLLNTPNVEVKSIFSHLAGADEAAHNDFSKQQAQIFERFSGQLLRKLPNKPLRHLVNSPGIIRFPEYHYDMVRLGIGLYGIEANNLEQSKLRPISSLKTIVSQINFLKKGETVGYSRKGKATKDMEVATIAIGYADGFSRALSNGIGQVFIHGKRANVVGNVCMDMTMVDVSDIPGVEIGDEVEIFGSNITISEVAKLINTIPYEILTNVNQRVKRVYFSE